MNMWISKNENSEIDESFENFNQIKEGDLLYIYWDDSVIGGFLLKYKLIKTAEGFDEVEKFSSRSIDLPYNIFYKTKAPKKIAKITENELNYILDKREVITQIDTEETSEKEFISFLERLAPVEKDIISLKNNIEFTIGQPNTGKSYQYQKSNLVDKEHLPSIEYQKIPVSGGVGNEYKGLQNTDLAITFDPINRTLRFGDFLQRLMSAIVNPTVPHIVFLDDFHNQDISSLLSEYTPLFKAQQKGVVPEINDSHEVYSSTYLNVEVFIKKWNNFIDIHCSELTMVPITNRISGNDLHLVYPDNFYLLGAANFNENTLNIFADWEDRANIIYKNPIKTFTPTVVKTDFIKTCIKLNTLLETSLKKRNIYDYEKYCFGLWKTVRADDTFIDDDIEQNKTVKFFFGMIRNALKFNNKNSLINTIGWDLIRDMQSNKWFKENIKSLTKDENSEKINYEILHELNIYEDVE